MRATCRRLERSAGRLHSAIKWLFPDWERIEWKVSSSSGCRTSPEQKSLQRFADPDGSRRAKTRSSWTSGTRRHRRPGEEFLAGLFHCGSTFSLLRLARFLLFIFSSPPQFGSRQGWSGLPSRGVRRKHFQRASIFTLRAEKPGVSGMFTLRDRTLADGRRRGAQSRRGKRVSAINSIDTKVWYRYRMDTWGIVI